MEKRIIAISVSLKAFDEVQRLRGERTWTGWLLQLIAKEHPDNQVIKDEIANLPKKKAKAEKPRKEKKAKSSKKAKAEKTDKEQQPQPTQEQMTAAEVSAPETRKS